MKSWLLHISCGVMRLETSAPFRPALLFTIYRSGSRAEQFGGEVILCRVDCLYLYGHKLGEGTVDTEKSDYPVYKIPAASRSLRKS